MKQDIQCGKKKLKWEFHFKTINQMWKPKKDMFRLAKTQKIKKLSEDISHKNMRVNNKEEKYET